MASRRGHSNAPVGVGYEEKSKVVRCLTRYKMLHDFSSRHTDTYLRNR